MIFRSHSRNDFRGHVDAICAHEIESCAEPFQCGEPRPIEKCKSTATAGNNLCHSHCTVVQPDPNDRKDGALHFILHSIFALLVALIALALIILAYRYGYEQGYWDGYWEGVRETQVANAAPDDYATPEGGPCRRWVQGVCEETKDARSAIMWSRHYLKKGDAESAIENWSRAMSYYRASMNLGSGVGAQSANYAAKRIQFQSMTCEYTPESLARISRDFEKNTLGAPIKMKQKQTALSALGYYNGNIDNRHGPESREAIRDFQGDLWFDQTGVLSAEQTVLLICGGAQIAKDIGAQNVLGIMYASGLGVRQNTDFALDWLESAAQRGDADAAWNLALMYGTQTVLSSVRVCDAVQNAERADSYLNEAANAGHPVAKTARSKYSHHSPEKRWSKISGDLNQPEAMQRVGRGCNPND